MSAPIQVVVADQQGLNISSLVAAITGHYRTPKGYPVTVKIGQGVHVDGVPQGTIRLVDDDSSYTDVVAPYDGMNL